MRSALVHSTARVLLAGAVALALGLAACSARADGPGPTEAEKDTARSLMAEGDSLFAKRDFDRALRAYRAADTIMHVPSTSMAVARAQAALGALVEAREKALSVARAPAAPNEPPPFVAARNEAGDLAEQLAKRIPSLAVRVTGATAGASVVVRIDGTSVPADVAAVRWNVNPGKHVVEASTPNDGEARVEVTATEGAALVVPLALSKAPGAVRGPLAPVSAPVTPLGPAASPPRSPLVAAGFALGAAALVTGAIAGGISLAKTSSLELECPGGRCPSNLAGDLHTAKALALVSDVAFPTAAVGVVLGVVGLVVSRRPANPGETSLSTPWPHVAGRGLAWSF